MTDLPLAAEFPQATRDQWMALVEKVLKGADFDRKLVSRTYDGIRIEPLYAKAEGARPRALGAAAGIAPWSVVQRLDHPDPGEANALALADLEGGASGLALVFAGAPAARGFGLAARTAADLERALAGAMLDLVHTRLDAGGMGRGAAALFLALCERRGHDLARLDVDLGLDPIGALAAGGRMSADWGTVARRSADTLAALAARGFGGRAFLADGRPYHEAGASEAQELAAVLATALAYLRALEAHGHGLAAARDAIAFLLVADADEFLTIAKFRALRRLWARVEEACGLAPRPIRLHAETAWRTTTKRDPWVNMLRATVAVFSAGLGGADSVTVTPFTAALGLPDAFARRIARNTQLILIEESNLWRVADPAAGAGGIEALTDELAHRAWALFQAIEGAGGMVEALRAGLVQDRIAKVRAEREAAVARRKDPITGTSEFPDIREAPVTVLQPATPPPPPAGKPLALPAEGSGAAFAAILDAAREGASLADIAAGAPIAGGFTVDPLPSLRAAEPFERLRDASDAHLAATGARPRVFLANLGPIAAFTARATFAKNFFEAGGIEAVTNDGFSSLDALAKACAASGARIACLCSSDEIYAAEAVAAAERLRSLVPAPVLYLAGRPGELEEALKASGVGRFIFVGCDLLGILETAQREAATG
ncbi:methylmalonyl-CoA mutase subunit beta [Chelatococcus sp. SYSU_G07232]|uniref:Methylmalonyl-CoA mutase subunit beta n=1 Tax=Chelatococcus albus TaxID=3047466 RepID=A0ABT7AJ71_9HYPH|nr:methylmalonyl-CoA mutase subunit beta [Chelatococcus sp. SYSU_G07232]MDJ1159422.1 methylmalonyl-CoA mutase subunit beta [Chelatococcus sp. SYSU_G07232]